MSCARTHSFARSQLGDCQYLTHEFPSYFNAKPFHALNQGNKGAFWELESDLLNLFPAAARSLFNISISSVGFSLPATYNVSYFARFSDRASAITQARSLAQGLGHAGQQQAVRPPRYAPTRSTLILFPQCSLVAKPVCIDKHLKSCTSHGDIFL